MLTIHDYEFITGTEASVIARGCLRIALKIKQACEGKTEFLKSLALFSESQFSQKLMESVSDEKTVDAELLKKEKTATAVVEDLYFKFEKRFPGINNLRQLCKDVLPDKLLKKGRGSSKKCLRWDVRLAWLHIYTYWLIILIQKKCLPSLAETSSYSLLRERTMK